MASGPAATCSTRAGSGWATYVRSIWIVRPGAPNGCSSRSRATSRGSSRWPTPTSSRARSASPIRRRWCAAAPAIGAEPRIDQSQERELYAHYRIGYSVAGVRSRAARRQRAAAGAGQQADAAAPASRPAASRTSRPTSRRRPTSPRRSRSMPRRHRSRPCRSSTHGRCPAPSATCRRPSPRQPRARPARSARRRWMTRSSRPPSSRRLCSSPGRGARRRHGPHAGRAADVPAPAPGEPHAVHAALGAGGRLGAARDVDRVRAAPGARASVFSKPAVRIAAVAAIVAGVVLILRRRR